MGHSAFGRALVAGAAVIVALGCKEVITSPTSSTIGAPKSLRLDVSSVAIDVGATARVAAQLLDSRGQPVAIPSTLTLAYLSSAPATFTVTSDGLVTGVAEGSGVLRATVGALQVGVPVVVTPGGPRLVSLSGDAQSAAPGAALPQPIRVRALQANGTPAAGVTVTFTVAQGSTAPASSVTAADGTAGTTWTLGTSVGVQTLAASAPGFAGVSFSATAAVQPVATVTVTPATVALGNVGDTRQLTAVARDAANNVIPGASFTWTSSNAAVATVSPTGLVTAIGSGTSTIAAAIGSISGGAQVTVTLPVPQPRIAFTPPTLAVTAPAGSSVIGSVDVVEAGGQAVSTLGTISCDAPTYTGTPPAQWLTVQACGTTIRINANAAALPAGTYQATIPVRATLAVNSPAALAVQLTVSASQLPVIAASPSGQLAFTSTPGDASGGIFNPTVNITNAGGGTLSGLAATVTYAPGQPTGWISNVALDAATAPTALRFRVTRAQLPAGTYDATIRLTSTVNGVVPLDIPVRLVANGGSAELGLSSDSIVTANWIGGPTVRAAVDVIELTGLGEAALGVVSCSAIRFPERTDWARVERCSDSVVIVFDEGRSFEGSDRAELDVSSSFTQNIVTLNLTFTAFRPQMAATPAQLSVVSQANGSTFRVAAAVDVSVPNGSPTPYPVGNLGPVDCGVAQLPPGVPEMQIVKCDIDSVAVTVTPNATTGRVRYQVIIGAEDANPPVGFTILPVDVNFTAAPPPAAPFRANDLYGTCAVGFDDALQCWGNNQYGQLGNGTTVDRNRPTPLSVPSGLSSLTRLAMGGDATCAYGFGAGSFGTYCWGRNDFGTTGVGTFAGNTTVPTRLALTGVDFASPSVGARTACVIRIQSSASQVFCWGSNEFGQVGEGTTDPGFNTPQQVRLPASSYAAVAAGGNHACAISTDARLYCWGQGWQLGNGTTSSTVAQSLPVTVTVPDLLTAGSGLFLAAGNEATCITNSFGRLYCWGSNRQGQTGIGTTSVTATPALVTFPAGVAPTDLTMGADHTCAIVDGATYCWGRNQFGQLGNGTTVNASTPVRVANDPGFAQVRAVGNTTCGLVASDGRVLCWGFGLTGEIGNGQNNNVSVPTGVIAP